MRYILCWLVGLVLVAIGIGILFEWVLEKVERKR